MAHLLRYGSATKVSLGRANRRHVFAHTYAMQIYDSNAVYSMIPKNGCTTLRLSLAIANGAIASPSDWDWIHLNNDTFKPSLKDLATARYRFTILRCPHRRLVSCFQEKIVKRTEDAQRFRLAAKLSLPLGKLTFRRFCREVAKKSVKSANIHWRPQVDFLVYDDYDDYFRFEEFHVIGPALKKRIGLELIDARPWARHDSSHYETLKSDDCVADLSLVELERLQKKGLYPRPESFFDSGLRDFVTAAYEDDIALYRAKFPDR